MHVGQAREPTPPLNLRPAQLGIVLLGRVISGHVSATLVDLDQRGFLSLKEIHDGAEGDWLLTDRRSHSEGASRELQDFEQILLDGLLGGQRVVRLSELGEDLVLSLRQMRVQLRRDAVRNGWLSRWRREGRTPRGEQLLTQIHSFRRELRAVAAAGEVTAGLAPYAMIFGLAGASGVGPPADDTHPVGRRNQEGDVAWARGDRLAQGWILVCDRIPAVAHAWSAPPGHQPGHGQAAHGGSHSGHSGHFDGGGHGGHFAGGGHGGH